MANYRQIHVQIWKDQWFLDLPADFKLLFIYLFSNERTSVAGIYDLALRVIEFETGLDVETIQAGFREFARAGKVYYEDGLVWVVNLRKYNATNSIKVRTRIKQDLLALPDCSLLRRYLEHEGCPMEEDTKETYVDPPLTAAPEQAAGTENPSGGYGIQKEEIPYPTGESEHDHVPSHVHAHVPVRVPDPAPAAESEAAASGAEEPAIHPAIVRFVTVTGRKVPNEAWAQRIEQAVGPDPPSIARWTRVINAWVGLGWNPGNVQGMLEYYERNEIPGKENSRGRNRTGRSAPAQEPALITAFGAEPDAAPSAGEHDTTGVGEPPGGAGQRSGP